MQASTSSATVAHSPPTLDGSSTAFRTLPFPFELELAPASIWNGATASSDVFTEATSRSLSDRLWQCYHDALWLGEYHTPLLSFLTYLSSLESATRDDMANLIAELGSMLRSRNEIKQRYNEDAAATIRGLVTNQTAKAANQRDLSSESKIIWTALQGGPPAVVKAEVLAEDADTLGQPSMSRWLKASESREIQLQLLLTMFLLKLIAQYTGSVEPAKGLMRQGLSTCSRKEESAQLDSDRSSQQDEERPKKRGRKLENPKRWKGSSDLDLDSDDFLWNRRTSSKKSFSDPFGTDDAAEADSILFHSAEPSAIEPEQLNKRFEALTDILCLDQITSELGMDLASLLGDFSEASKSEASQTNGAKQPTIFGSAARNKGSDDPFDEAQWLCVEVIEPFFGQTLPRQCSVMRGKCFVPASTGNTPARGQVPAAVAAERRSKTASSREVEDKRTRPATNRSTTKQLRDALRDEKASASFGRRPSRGAGGELLGRGREVDMNRRFSRSASATALGTHLEAGDGTAAKSFVTGKLGKRKSEAVRRPPTKEKVALVLSTPQKSRLAPDRNLSQTQPLVLRRTESQPRLESQRYAEWGGPPIRPAGGPFSQMPEERSPSPVALFSGSEDEGQD